MLKTTKPEFRIFRSTRSPSLYSVHQVDSKENSIAVMKSDVSFDKAQETMLQLKDSPTRSVDLSKIKAVIQVETI